VTAEQAAFRASPQQERLWIAQPDGPRGRLQATVRLAGPLEPETLRSALGAVVDRHEILRTTFPHRPGIKLPFQLIHAELPPSFTSVDLSAAAPLEPALRELARDEREAELDPERGPLLRAAHAVLGGDRHLLVLTASLLCLDAASLPALLGELASRLGADAEVPDEPLQYADYAEWQHELAASDEQDAVSGRDWWADQEDLHSPSLPFAGEPSAEARREEAEVPFDAPLAAAVVDLAGRYGVSPESVVHAAWQALIARLAGAEEVASAVLHGGPGRDPLDGLIGPIARPLPVQTPIDLGTTFAELAASVGRTRSDALAWEDYAPAGDGLELGFATSAGFRATGTDVRIELEAVHAVPGRGLWLVCHDLAGSAKVHISYEPAALASESANHLADQLGRILRGAAADPSTPTGRLELLSDDERRQLLEVFNSTGSGSSAPTLQERFAAHAATRPDAVAVEDGTRSLTYGELAGRAGRLARHLVASGVVPGSVVGLCTDRSVDMVVGLLGILQAGAAFLPLNFEHPGARLEHQLSEAGCRFLVTQSRLRSLLPGEGLELVLLDDEASATETGNLELPPARPGNLAYVIYTSGSTGRPKGVGVTGANLANYVDHVVRSLRAEDEPLSFGMVTALSTDLGHTAVFPALGSGGTLTLIMPVEAADAASLARRLERTPVDVMKITPSHLQAVLAAGDPRVLPRRWLVMGGERLGWDLVERVRRLGACGLINHYGPTETTVGSCMLTVGEDPGPWSPASVPIGGPISGTRCYLLDRWRQPVPVGTPGSLFIAGAGVASGYVGQPELTGERFLPDPFAAEGGTMYDTGDLARWLPDGTLEYLGRADEQVKIRGYRVEPGEVEEALGSHPATREAAVAVREDGNGNPRLVAYVVHEPGVQHRDLVAHLAELVPDYMVPAAFVSLDALPRTPSGKVDRGSLPKPDEPDAGQHGTAPRTPLEEAVAGIWSQVLGVEPIGVEDDFFALGGHSLLAAQVVAQVRSDFAVELPMHSLFTMPTVATLSVEIGRLMGSADEDETAALLANLEELSDEEAERLLAEHSSPLDQG